MRDILRGMCRVIIWLCLYNAISLRLDDDIIYFTCSSYGFSAVFGGMLAL